MIEICIKICSPLIVKMRRRYNQMKKSRRSLSLSERYLLVDLKVNNLASQSLQSVFIPLISKMDSKVITAQHFKILKLQIQSMVSSRSLKNSKITSLKILIRKILINPKLTRHWNGLGSISQQTVSKLFATQESSTIIILRQMATQ